MKPTDYVKMVGLWQEFSARHPKFPQFLQALMQNKIHEGTIFEMTVTSPEGEELCTNLKITSEDMALFEQLKAMR